MSETPQTQVPSRETGIEALVKDSSSQIIASQKVFIASPDHCLDTIVSFASPEDVKQFWVRAKEIPYFNDLNFSVFGYTATSSKGKEVYVSLSELKEGSAEVDFHSPLVPILNVGGGTVSYQELLLMENAQLRSMLGKKGEENQSLETQTTRLKRLALRDELTGCLNQNSYILDQRKHVTYAVESGTTLCFVEIDLKNLKILNDVYGKKVGDEAIEKLGSLLRLSFRRENRDFVYRIGGDEFGIVIYDSTPEGIEGRLQFFSDALATLRIKNPHYVSNLFVKQDAYIRIFADVGHDLNSFKDLSVGDLRGQGPTWYRERFTEQMETPVDNLMKLNKLSSDDPNMGTHRRTAQYKAGTTYKQAGIVSKPNIQNRTKRFLKEVLNI